MIPALVFTAFMGLATPILAHEFWLEPLEYTADAGAGVKVQIRNGQKFSGIELAYFDNRIVMFDWLQSGQRAPIQARAGDAPAVNVPNAGDGLVVLAYQSTPSTLTYREWALFENFVTHKGFAEAIERHRARALPEVNFKEIYTRYCKTLIGVGSANGQDAQTGMEAEIVALANPYTEDLRQGMPVQVFYQGAPHSHGQIEVFDRDPTGKVVTSIVQTDDAGRAIVPVNPGHEYLFDSVVLREPTSDIAQEKGAVWESLWASLTFAVPE